MDLTPRSLAGGQTGAYRLDPQESGWRADSRRL